MEHVRKQNVIIENENNVELSELLKEFNPTIEAHIKTIDDQVSEVLMGRCPPGTRPGN